MDETGTNLMFADEESVWTCNINYSETVCKEGMRLILVKVYFIFKFIQIT